MLLNMLTKLQNVQYASIYWRPLIMNKRFVAEITRVWKRLEMCQTMHFQQAEEDIVSKRCI